MAILGSRKVTSVVVPASVTEDKKELLIEFRNGLATVPKVVKKFLLGRSPELYFDPREGEPTSNNKFGDDYEALEYYIAKIKQSGNPAKLCSLLKGHYESLQGELMSGKYNVKQEVPVKKMKKPEPEIENNDDEDDPEDEALVTGAGDKIKTKKEK